MTNDINDPKFAGGGPSAAYAFNRDRVLHAEGSPEAAHEAGLKAHEAAVFGADAKRDRNGNFIQQGIGSPGHETANHFAGILRWEGREAHDRAVRAAFKRDAAHARSIGLVEPPRLNA